jgi:hypothetical protein
MQDTLTGAAQVHWVLNWDYESHSDALARLYEKGKASQWNATDAIDWTPEIPFGAPLPAAEIVVRTGSVLEGLEPNRLNEYRWEFQAWMASQFLHGEQGALLASARLVETVPTRDQKFYAANQVADEARHVEAYARYVNEKLQHEYPISAPLRALLEDIIGDSRWDITYLGMQIMVEGLALAAFRLASSHFHDPVIRQITDMVMRDEARHVAFGVLALDGYFDELTTAERRVREEFVIEAATLLHERFLLDDVWLRMGIDVKQGRESMLTSPVMSEFRRNLFSKIVPNLNKLGLLTGAVRERFAALDILRFASAPADGDDAASHVTLERV